MSKWKVKRSQRHSSPVERLLRTDPGGHLELSLVLSIRSRTHVSDPARHGFWLILAKGGRMGSGGDLKGLMMRGIQGVRLCGSRA